MAVPRFERKPPPLAARVAAGVFMRCVFAPIMWGAQKIGIGRKDAGFRQRQARAGSSPKRIRSADYVPGPQDVFVMTYAKSGTNWMMQIVHQLIHHGKGEFDHIHDVVPWPDAVLMGPMMRNYAIPLEQATELADRARAQESHQDAFQLGVAAVFGRGAVHRGDPRSQGCFCFGLLLHEGQRHGRRDARCDTMYRVFLAGKFLLGGSWPANAAGYWAQRHRPNVLVVSFASMKRDLEGTVRRVAGFLDIHVPNEVIRAVCEKASFDYMKRIDHKFGTGKLTRGTRRA